MSALKPDVDSTHDLGTTALRWKALHVDTFTTATDGADCTVGSNLVVTGNLTVNGSTTTVTTSDLLVKDKNILINDGGDAGSAAGAGLDIEEGGSVTGYLRVATDDRGNLDFKAPNGEVLKLDVNTASTFTIGGSLTIESASVLNQDLTTNADVVFNKVTANGGLVADNLTLDGTSLTLSTGDFTLDVAGDIILDADGDDITFKAGAGDTTGLKWTQSNSGDWTNLVGTQDKDLIFQVNDGGAATEVMRLDGDVSSLLMAGTKKITFGDAGSFVHQSANGKLAISSDGAAADAVVVTTSNAAGGIDIDAGTGGIAIDSTGAFSVDGAAASNITVTTDTDAEDLTISVAGATNSSLILSSSGTAADALSISTSAGGIDITVAGAAAGEDLDLTSNTSINITSAEDADDAVVISGLNGGVTIDAGGDSPVEINASNAPISIGNDDVNQNINIGGAGDRTINIGVDSHANTIDLSAQTITLDAGASGFTIDGGAASSVSTSAGALTVNGTAGLNLQENGTNVISIDTNQDVLFSRIGGDSGDPDVEFWGYVKFAYNTEFDKPVQMNDILTANAAVSVQSTLTVGENDTGYDVKLFGATSGQYLLWDESADELVLAGDSKLSFHDAAGGENIIATSDGHLEINSGTTLDMTAPTVDINASTAVTVESATFTLGSVDVATALNPTLTIQHTGNSTSGGTLKFVKDKGAAGVQGDDAGVISFFADNAAQNQKEFARITAEVQTATDSSEDGKLSLIVAQYDGAVDVAGLTLTGGAADGVVNVSIGAGLASTTTIAGNLTVNGTTTTVNSTTLLVDDKNIELGVGSANDAAADGGGITLKSGDGNKTFNWVDATDSWTSSEDLDLVNGKHLSIAGVTVLDADGAAKVKASVVDTANNGLAHSSGELSLDLNDLSAADVSVANDSIAIIDADDNGTKKESIEDLVAGIAGVGLSASSGALAVDLNELTGADINVAADSIPFLDADGSATRIESVGNIIAAVAGDGLSASSGALAVDLNELTGADINVAADSIAIIDADDNGTKKESIEDLVAAVAGDGLAASGGVLSLDINELTAATIASGDYLAFSDEASAGDPTRKETIDNIATLFAGDGLTASTAVIGLDLNELTAADVSVAADSIAIIDADDSNGTKKESIEDLVAGIAGTGISASSGQLSIAATHNHITVTAGTNAAGADFDIGLSETLTVNGTSNEVNVSLAEDAITIGLPSSVTISSDLQANNFIESPEVKVTDSEKGFDLTKSTSSSAGGNGTTITRNNKFISYTFTTNADLTDGTTWELTVTNSTILASSAIIATCGSHEVSLIPHTIQDGTNFKLNVKNISGSTIDSGADLKLNIIVL